jgi:hypothetical protein
LINEALRQRMTGIQHGLMATYEASLPLPNAAKGSEREAFLRDYLEKLYPASNRFSSGAITDSSGHLSGQVDIAVEQPFCPSFPSTLGDERLLLAESVAAVIEVKSDVQSQWSQACNTVQKVKSLQRQYGASIGFGSISLDKIPCAVVGYKGFGTGAALDEKLKGTAESSRPDAVLTIESGVFIGGGISATGWMGLYCLCIFLNNSMRSLTAASVNLLDYLQ